MKISQREANRLGKRVQELERILSAQRNAWVRDWPGGVNIASLTVPDTSYTAIDIARKLGHAVVVVADGNHGVRFMAIKNQ